MNRYPSRAADRQTRHLVYFSILDALARVGCPVCTLGLRAVERYLDGVAYEQVNDPGVRAVLRNARGFCTHHAWQFADLPHAHLGTAIIYRDIAATVLHELKRRPLLPFAGRRAVVRAGALTPRRPCPACVVRDDASTTALRALVGYLDAGDPELLHCYQAAGGLCRPHLAAALALTRRPRTRAMLTATATAALNAATEPSVATAIKVELLAGTEGAMPVILRAAAEWQGRDPITTPQKSSGGRPCPTPLAAHCPALPLTLSPSEPSPRPSPGPLRTAVPIDAAGRGTGSGTPLPQAGEARRSLPRQSRGTGPVPESTPVMPGAGGLGVRACSPWRGEGSGCVACSGALAAADDFLCQLAQGVADGDRPASVLALCNHHTWRLVRVAPEAGPRAVQRALTAPGSSAVAIKRDEDRSGPWRSPWRLAPRRQTAPAEVGEDGCPACRVEMTAAQRALAEAGASAGAEGISCCLPHVLLGMPLMPGLLSAQAVHLARLVADLDRAIRKHDYRFRDEPWGAAYDAPRRAVAHIAGARGLALRGLRL